MIVLCIFFYMRCQLVIGKKIPPLCIEPESSDSLCDMGEKWKLDKARGGKYPASLGQKKKKNPNLARLNVWLPTLKNNCASCFGLPARLKQTMHTALVTCQAIFSYAASSVFFWSFFSTFSSQSKLKW